MLYAFNLCDSEWRETKHKHSYALERILHPHLLLLHRHQSPLHLPPESSSPQSSWRKEMQMIRIGSSFFTCWLFADKLHVATYFNVSKVDLSWFYLNCPARHLQDICYLIGTAKTRLLNYAIFHVHRIRADKIIQLREAKEVEHEVEAGEEETRTLFQKDICFSQTKLSCMPSKCTTCLKSCGFTPTSTEPSHPPRS